MLATVVKTALRRPAGAAATRGLASAASSEPLRGIHFTEDAGEARPFRIVGVRDVEVQDWEFPTRVEAEQRGARTLRNRFQHPNFISLWVDKLPAVEAFLKQEKLPVAAEGIVKGPEGHDVLIIPPSEDGSLELFNLCDNPTMVELVQATDDVIREFEEDQEFAASQEFEIPEEEEDKQ